MNNRNVIKNLYYHVTLNINTFVFFNNIRLSQVIEQLFRRYMAEILPIRRKTLSNQSINQSINSTTVQNVMV